MILFSLSFFLKTLHQLSHFAHDESLVTFFISFHPINLSLCAVLVGHPFDLVKVRMQTGTVGTANSSVFGIMRKTLVSEGITGLYRGVSAPIVAVSPIYAISFWGYDIGQRIVGMFRKDDLTRPLNLLEISIAGGISAFPATAIMAPTERIKCLVSFAFLF